MDTEYRKKVNSPHESDKDTCEYVEETWLPAIKRRRRFTINETRILEEEYEINSSPNQEKIQAIANRISTPRKIVTTWFQNRRAKNKRRQRIAKKEEEEDDDDEEEDLSSQNATEEEQAINDIIPNDSNENNDHIANEIIVNENAYYATNVNSTIETSLQNSDNITELGSNHVELMASSDPCVEQKVIPTTEAELRLWLPLFNTHDNQHQDIILNNYFPYLHNNSNEQNLSYNHRSHEFLQQQESYATIDDDLIDKGRVFPYYINELFPVSNPTFTVLNSENQFYISPLDLNFYHHYQGEEEE
ncbi:uncharacterized protein BX663DRAFT_501852 [Cokeromyces recurvatus]|uniref:uncharacterized protein n=1 Tax=Cokeromyces recurvatus TaxID=90255 RepID=UPI00221FDF7E|nr:uncharacterized protein BX663DRAFT_501852 [Cokeromyces recurvatus]KAI7905126.1 hypothetical protein BX663DRAFT_501852 [Cokeromyces recurvatus]